LSNVDKTFAYNIMIYIQQKENRRIS